MLSPAGVTLSSCGSHTSTKYGALLLCLLHKDTGKRKES
jgi:hypothetical protein